MANQTLYLSTGQQLKLGETLGQGGEGSVFAVSGQTGDVAKIYSKPVSRDKAEKLQAMVEFGSPTLYERMAWPKAIIVPGPDELPVGFLMPRIEGFEEVHDLYSPKSRHQKFPAARWKFLTHTAINICAAFMLAHKSGIVIGDVNEKNIRVSEKTTIRLIDCDSFQLARNGKKYLCEVGVEHFTPPELQGGSFRGVERTPNHDAFGLAILIFYLLFMGRHPYSGRYLGKGEMPLGRAIQENRFAYGSQAKQRRTEPPPHTLPLSVVGSDLSTLFERAFAPPSPAFSRPDPQEWSRALKEHFRSLVKCQKNPSHQYRQDSKSCPWCLLESKAGLQFFAATPITAKTSAKANVLLSPAEIDRLWQLIEMVKAPSPPAVVTVPSAQPSSAIEIAATRYVFGSYGALAVAIAAAVVIFMLPITIGAMAVLLILDLVAGLFLRDYLVGESKAKRNTALIRLQHAESNLNAVKARWEDSASDKAFQSRLEELRSLKNEYASIGSKKQERLKALQQSSYARHRDRYMDSYRIDRAAIPNIGPGRAASLMSYGIETALDVNRSAVLAVPGFGTGLADVLVAWRQSIEAQFNYLPSSQVLMSDISAVDQWAESESRRIAGALQRGPTELAQLKSAAERKGRLLRTELENAMAAAAQARVDADAFSSGVSTIQDAIRRWS